MRRQRLAKGGVLIELYMWGLEYPSAVPGMCLWKIAMGYTPLFPKNIMGTSLVWLVLVDVVSNEQLAPLAPSRASPVSLPFVIGAGLWHAFCRPVRTSWISSVPLTS